MRKYIHYGASEYDPSKFKPIKNRELFPKPEGGFWATPADAERGWKEWCEGADFHVDKLETSFKFTLTENAKLLQLNSPDDLEGLPRVQFDLMPSFSAYVCLDFEKLAADGVDAIEVNISNDYTPGCEGLYWKLYGWDCDSVLVLNKEVVVPC